jgi:hypothetical protein
LQKLHHGRPLIAGTWHKELKSSGYVILFKQYRTGESKSCQARSQCTRSKTARHIHRTEYAEYYKVNRRNYEENEQLYKRRQAMVEHHYGTLKRQSGFNYTLTKKGMKRASSDVGFMFIAPPAGGLRRIGNILTGDLQKEYLRIIVSLLLTYYDPLRRILMQFKRPVLPEQAIREVKIDLA